MWLKNLRDKFPNRNYTVSTCTVHVLLNNVLEFEYNLQYILSLSLSLGYSAGF